MSKKVRPVVYGSDIYGKTIGIIKLTKGQISIIDLEDVNLVGQYNWFAHSRPTKYKTEFCASRNVPTDAGKQKTMRLHRFIMNCPCGMEVDHLNGNSLDNRKNNLKIVNHHENCQNRHNERSSKYPGVYWDITSQKWVARIRNKDKSYSLGRFDSELDAAQSYRDAYGEIKKTGALNRPNFKTSSKYKGVTWDKESDKWMAQIYINGKRKFLGRFFNELEAARAYQNACKELL